MTDALLKEFTIISRQVIERELYVRASSASEAMKYARDNIETSYFLGADDMNEKGIFSTSDILVIDKRFRHGDRHD